MHQNVDWEKSYEQSIVEIGKDLNINVATLKSFMFQIVEQSGKSITFMGGILVFPEQLLIFSNQKDDTLYFM